VFTYLYAGLNTPRGNKYIVGRMKTTLRTWTAVCVSVLTATAAVTASADETAAVKHEKTYTGMVASFEPKERLLEVKGYVLSKRFNLGEACAFVPADKAEGAIADLRPGQKVKVGYRDVQGVLVADRIEQQPIQVEGTVKALDLQKHSLTLDLRGTDKTFQLPDDCKIVLRNNKAGEPTDVRIGHRVTLMYENPGNALVARQIAQMSATFTGTLTAIDTAERTVKAKSLTGTKKFNLADGCRIVLQGRPDREIRDLKPGDKLEFNYDEVNGVNVASRIANPGKQELMTATGK